MLDALGEISRILNQNSVNSEFVKWRPRISRPPVCIFYFSVAVLSFKEILNRLFQIQSLRRYQTQKRIGTYFQRLLWFNSKRSVVSLRKSRKAFEWCYRLQKKKPITIEIACVRKMMKLINLKTRDYYRSVSLDALTPVSEPSYEIKEEVAQDYTLYEKIVSSLNLTENMRIALECRQNGLSYPEIGRVLSRAQATVYEYFIKMRKRYMAIYG